MKLGSEEVDFWVDGHSTEAYGRERTEERMLEMKKARID
jgi:hypothetical protein